MKLQQVQKLAVGQNSIGCDFDQLKRKHNDI